MTTEQDFSFLNGGNQNTTEITKEPRLSSTCNSTKYFEWSESRAPAKYLDTTLLQALVNIGRSSKAWRTLDFDTTRSKFMQGRLILTNAMVMESSYYLCSELLEGPHNIGDHGPISIQDRHGLMCSPLCLIHDELRNQALAHSECTCLDLSTQKNDSIYKREGDWCEKNSGFLLCEKMDACGVWDCKLEDFQCSRMEYDYNYGQCNPGSFVTIHPILFVFFSLIIITLYI
jgi:hypothetical protein